MYVGSEMAVVAHTVGPDTVGPLAETMVDGESFEDTFWRGMMIKDNVGDWGLCIAGWKGVRRGVAGVAGTSSRKGTHESPSIWWKAASEATRAGLLRFIDGAGDHWSCRRISRDSNQI